MNGVFYAILVEPFDCPVCHRQRFAVANRNGVTRCIDCDAKKESKR